MKHLTLPTLPDSGLSTHADIIATIEPLTGKTCRIHFKATDSDMVKRGTHNQIDVRLPANELRNAVTKMNDEDVYDPWDLQMTKET